MDQPDFLRPFLDRDWLESMGYTDLDDDQVHILCRLARAETEQRTGARLFDLLDDTQQQQADVLFGNPTEKACLDWLNASGAPIPDDIIAIADQSGPAAALETLCDQIPTIWLQHSGLPYKQIVAIVRDEITDEFRTHRSAITAHLTATCRTDSSCGITQKDPTSPGETAHH